MDRTPLTNEDMIRLGVALTRAMLRSASTEKIRPIEWWTRAKSALETAAASSSTFSGLVTVMGRKLQIEATTERTGQDLVFIADAVGDEFEAFRRFLATEALYVVAIAQAERKTEKDANELLRRNAGATDGHSNHETKEIA